MAAIGSTGEEKDKRRFGGFDPERLFQPGPRFAARDWIMLAFVVLMVGVANVIYVFDLGFLYHDDNQSFYLASNYEVMMRGGGNVSRHAITDSFLLHLMATASPLVARITLIVVAAIPMAVLGYLALRLAFRLKPEAAAIGAAGPLIVAGQWQVIVGINLSYIIFDVAFFFAAILLLTWAKGENRTTTSLFATLGIFAILSDGIFSAVIMGPGLLLLSLAIRPSSRFQSALILTGILAATTKTIVEERASRGGLDIASDPIGKLLASLPTPLNDLLPGGAAVAWVALFALAAFAAYTAYLAIRSRNPAPFTGLWLAAALYLGAVFVYVVFRGGFSNRYGFIPTVAVFMAVAYAVHAFLYQFEDSNESTAAVNSSRLYLAAGPAGAAVLLIICALAYHKSQYQAQIFGLMDDAARAVKAYFAPRHDPIAASVRLNTDAQLIVLAESNFPYMYPHRYPALGWLRFVTGDPQAVGFAGGRKLCADPFEPWVGPWELGPGGFAKDLPISAHAFRGPNGTGQRLDHLLATQTNSLDAPDAAWTLYEVGAFGARPAAEGTGRTALETRLAELGIEPHRVAFSCGL